MVGAAVRAAPDAQGPGFMLSLVQVLVVRVLVGAESGCTAGELAAATAAVRTMPVAPAVTTLEARGLVHGHRRCTGARTEWAWSLTALGQHTAEEMGVVEAFGAIVEVGYRRLISAGEDR
ncbi:hypothetical protein [Nocardia pseudovaccinii]|uniref:hypothetical protein n=1 Tax=Nocardia pseudovaccinii TaxID=189540 RepID=UPI0007A4DAA4|nr:hypothetical protein [Nocardia pseudovaccinii]